MNAKHAMRRSLVTRLIVGKSDLVEVQGVLRAAANLLDRARSYAEDASEEMYDDDENADMVRVQAIADAATTFAEIAGALRSMEGSDGQAISDEEDKLQSIIDSGVLPVNVQEVAEEAMEAIEDAISLNDAWDSENADSAGGFPD